MIDKVKALLGALPTWLGLVQSVLTVVATQVVPLLPGNVGLRVGAVVALAAGWVATAVSLVSRVTPVPAAARGLTVAPGERLRVELSHPGGVSATETSG